MNASFKIIGLSPELADQIECVKELVRAAVGRAPEPRPAIDDEFVGQLFEAMPPHMRAGGHATAVPLFLEKINAFATAAVYYHTFDDGATAGAIAGDFAGFCRGCRILVGLNESGPVEGSSGASGAGLVFWTGLGSFRRGEFLKIGQRLVDAVFAAAHSDLGSPDLRSHAHSLLDAAFNVKPEDAASVSAFAEALFGEKTRVLIHAFLNKYEHFLFESSEETLYGFGVRLRDAFACEPAEDTKPIVNELLSTARKWHLLLELLRDLSSAFNALRTCGFIEDSAKAVWTDFIFHLRAFSHDVAGMINGVNGWLAALQHGVTPERVFPHLLSRQAGSTLGSLIGKVLHAVEDSAKAKGIAIAAQKMPPFAVPAGYRCDLYRAIFELAFNAIKYSDPANAQRIVRISSEGRAAEGRLLISVWDNGVGIRDTEAAKRDGVRERPDLAEGTGLGLAGIDETASRNGWDFELTSQAEGEETWTEAVIGIPLSSLLPLAAK
ncbi:MAG: ATP-binding protein [bacterium]